MVKANEVDEILEDEVEEVSEDTGDKDIDEEKLKELAEELTNVGEEALKVQEETFQEPSVVGWTGGEQTSASLDQRFAITSAQDFDMRGSLENELEQVAQEPEVKENTGGLAEVYAPEHKDNYMSMGGHVNENIRAESMDDFNKRVEDSKNLTWTSHNSNSNKGSNYDPRTSAEQVETPENSSKYLPRA